MTANPNFSARITAALLTVVLPAAWCGAAEEAVSDEQIEALVNDLISPNEAPRTGRPYAKYPAGYDREAQKRVRRAFHKLRELAPRSIPSLFDHVDDQRYSLTADSGDMAEETKSPETYSETQRESVQKRLDELRNSESPLKPGFPYAR